MHLFVPTTTSPKTMNTNQDALGLLLLYPSSPTRLLLVLRWECQHFSTFFFFIFVWREGTPGLHHSLPFLTLLFCTKNETKKLGLLKVFGCCMAQLQATFIPSTVFVQNAARSPCTQPLPTHSRHNKCWILSSGLSSYHAIREGPVPCIHILYFVSHQNK